MSSGLSTENIFNLVNKFGDEEDRVTASFGFMLKANPIALQKLVQKLGIELTEPNLKPVEVKTQVSYSILGSRIDLLVKLPDRFVIFLESKLGSTPLGKTQLLKYARILESEKRTIESVRLVFVTQFDRRTEFEKQKGRIMRLTSLNSNEIRYIRWEDVRRLIAANNRDASKRYLTDLFLDYLGDSMADRKMVGEQKVEDVEQVLIQSTDPDWWEFILKKKQSTQHSTAPETQFIAFYRTDKHAITHIAEVKFSEVEERRKTFHGFPRILKKLGERDANLRGVHKVYHLKEIVELPRWIEKRPGEAPVRNMWKKPLTTLIEAKTLSDLKSH